MASSTTNTTIYFGYGSNLWRQQMINRCPNSTYLGIARLNDYRWIINERGYANVVELNKSSSGTKPGSDGNASYANEVWGLVYSLTPSDEDRLDGNEGVPVAYTKENLTCDFWRSSTRSVDTVREKPSSTDMLVYISRDKVAPSEPKDEYVYRMNMGIKDALKAGVPGGYVDEVMRKFIPDVEDERVREVADRQALRFKEEE